jgi:protein-tyrosine kinase
VSFIEKAIDLAKSARSRGEDQQQQRGLEKLLEEQLPQTGAEPHITEEIRNIHYTTTKTVPVQLETLIRNRLICGGVNPEIVQGYKLLRTHVLQKTLAQNRNVLMITSPLPNDGKTLTAINLAISISQELSQTVLLVDLDLRFPSIPNYFGFKAEKGLVDYLEGKATIPELLVHPQGIDGLVILPAGQATEWATELLRSPSMMDLVVELKNFYKNRYILFDLPPMLSYADALTFAPQVDGIIMVVAARQTPRESLQRCQEMLKDYPIIGYVLNRTDESMDSYYYDNAYHRDDTESKTPWWRRLFS